MRDCTLSWRPRGSRRPPRSSTSTVRSITRPSHSTRERVRRVCRLGRDQWFWEIVSHDPLTLESYCGDALFLLRADPVLSVLDAMQSACTNQPNAVLGETIPIKRALFNTTTIGTATATASATATTSPSQTSGNTVPATTSATVTPTSTTVPASVDKKSSGLSSGAAAGVGVGCGIIAIAMIGLAWFFFRRRAARRQSAPPGYEYGESKPALLSSPVAEDQYPHAQQLGSTEVHEIDSSSGGQGAWTGTNELDGRPLK